ncbi:MAG: hypothetical protein GY798_18090 [Hyphomicrobiales bacterium]|nr:hypothetical protein [Hyphomicrobiales bacterium]
MSYFGWPSYVSVAERRRRARQMLAELRAEGNSVSPITIEGRTIARSFWGRSWCTNLELYSDYANRLPRGRSYVRNGSVLDLQIRKGEVVAIVAGSDLYNVSITVTPVRGKRWKSICQDCGGTIDSLVELLQGRLTTNVMDRVSRKGDGLFPSPGEIELSCDCPDWADMCKHVAAALYGIGARLDQEPHLLFVLRGVDEKDLLVGAGPDELNKGAPAGDKVLEDSDVAALFGLEMAATVSSDAPGPAAKRPRSKTPKHKEAASGKKPPAAKRPRSEAPKHKEAASEKKSPVVKRSRSKAPKQKEAAPEKKPAAARSRRSAPKDAETEPKTPAGPGKGRQQRRRRLPLRQRRRDSP